jgi:hypothetical protein
MAAIGPSAACGATVLDGDAVVLASMASQCPVVVAADIQQPLRKDGLMPLTRRTKRPFDTSVSEGLS